MSKQRAASRVGTISNDVAIAGLIPQTANGIIYNVVPRAGEPARFGFVLNAPPAKKIVLQSPASLRPTDFGLDTTLKNLPQTATVAGVPAPITIRSYMTSSFVLGRRTGALRPHRRRRRSRGIFETARTQNSAVRIISIVARKPTPKISERQGDQPSA